MKGWLERVLVPGVAFVFDHKHRVRPGMQNIRRIGAITTSPHSRVARLRGRDAGKRTTARTLRLSAHKRCRTTFVSVPTPADDEGLARIAPGPEQLVEAGRPRAPAGRACSRSRAGQQGQYFLGDALELLLDLCRRGRRAWPETATGSRGRSARRSC